MANSLGAVNNSQSERDDKWNTWTLEVVPAEHHVFTMDEISGDLGLTEKTLSITTIRPGFDAGGKQMASEKTSEWVGVPLWEVLNLCRINNITHTPNNMKLVFFGEGSTTYKSKKTSLKVAVAMDPTREIILAYKKDGERLSEEDGYPLRLILPGFVSAGMLKKLNKIQVQPENTQATYVEECLKLKINSVITHPTYDTKLDESSLPTFNGYAYSGGGCKGTRVEISLDGGETWNKCKLDPLETTSKYDKFWCCRNWSIEVDVGHAPFSAESNVKEIVVRAFDESGKTQPDNQIPNIGGMNNCWYKVKVKHLEGEKRVIFEHPTDPRGNQVANDQPVKPSHSGNDQVERET